MSVVVDGGPALPFAALYSILSHALQSSLKAASNLVVADEQLLNDKGGPNLQYPP